MEVVPRYDLPPGTELSVHSRTLTVTEKVDHGYEVHDTISGNREFLPYIALARHLQQPGFKIKKPWTQLTTKAALRLKTVTTHKSLSNKQQDYGSFLLAICKAISDVHHRTKTETENPKFEFSQRKLNDDVLRDPFR